MTGDDGFAAMVAAHAARVVGAGRDRAVVGPLVGGLLVDAVPRGRRLVFLINVPFAVLVVLASPDLRAGGGGPGLGAPPADPGLGGGSGRR